MVIVAFKTIKPEYKKCGVNTYCHFNIINKNYYFKILSVR